MTEGYIKYNCHLTRIEIQLQEKTFQELEASRVQLYKLGLIGMYPDGIGFGNISVRENEQNEFVISGSATGHKPFLKKTDYALVTKALLNENTLFCKGLIAASSESMTHAAIYQTMPDVGAVVHVHCEWLWLNLLGMVPTTPENIEYGTPGMALAVSKIVAETGRQDEKIIVMGGHREGIITYGHTLVEATIQILNFYNRYKHD